MVPSTEMKGDATGSPSLKKRRPKGAAGAVVNSLVHVLSLLVHQYHSQDIVLVAAVEELARRMRAP